MGQTQIQRLQPGANSIILAGGVLNWVAGRIGFIIPESGRLGIASGKVCSNPVDGG